MVVAPGRVRAGLEIRLMTPPDPSGLYCHGMHSLTACGAVTLFDVKRIDTSLRGLALDIRRMLGGYG